SEIDLVKKAVKAAGARVAVSTHWQFGGAGAEELANEVIAACEEKPDFKFLYEASTPHKERIERIAKEVYGADGVTYSDKAEKMLKKVQDSELLAPMGTCMVKTHLSLSHEPSLKGRPKGWTLPIEDVLVYQGAEFIVPVAGGIKLMPGTASDPAFRRIDVDTDTGKVTGLF
ncbi:MAG: formate--tetrahydrofolate ligase, partial [Spirochaetota bacterium]|nr:formate--tetrahydrofolate ligase [Spirochaetota bacterium]